ncbi:MAG: SecY-interacting protein Syd [Pseudomonadota bacterium]
MYNRLHHAGRPFPSLMTPNDVTLALEDFIARALVARDADHFTVPLDPDWRSPCELNPDTDAPTTHWRPVRQEPSVDFRGLENALECNIHPDIQAFYGSFWSGSFEARSMEGHVSLIQLWNEEDFDRLIANLIGHALAKQRARLPFTVFFATTEPESELFLSIENETGYILLEEPGRPPVKRVEDNLARFLRRLDPIDSPPVIY